MPAADSIQLSELLMGLRFRLNEPLQAHVPLRLGGRCRAWIWVSNRKEMLKALKSASKAKLQWKVHWPFEDWIVRDQGFNGVVIRPCGDFERISETEEGVDIGSGALWSDVGQRVGWLNEMTHWPGSVGAVFTSGQALCLKGYHMELEILKGRRIQMRSYASTEDIPTLEKGETPLKITLKGRRLRKKKGPMRSGILFKELDNPTVKRALKNAEINGVRLRDWRISTINEGQVINLKQGNCTDLLLLAKGLQERIKKTSGKKPEIRIPIIGSQKRA